MTLIKWTPRPMTIFDDMDNMVNSVFNADWHLPTPFNGYGMPFIHTPWINVLHLTSGTLIDVYSLEN